MPKTRQKYNIKMSILHISKPCEKITKLRLISCDNKAIFYIDEGRT